LGGAVCKVMEASGRAPMPWQRDALAVACEIDPATGTFWYDTIILVVLRRAGKTTISRAKLTHRALTTVDGRMIYTAQNRLKALKRLRDDFYLPLFRSPLRETLEKPRWRGGEEAVRWKTGAEGHIDEAYAHADNTLEGGLQPTLMTVEGSQLWVLSAAGKAHSGYLRDKVEVGRALVESKRETRTCYIEYSAPEDWDPADPETVANTHPGIGHTISLERVMSLRDASKDMSEWERAWLGWWAKPKTPPRVIPTSAWESNYTQGDDEAWTGTPFWTIDTSPDRETTAIAMAAESTVKGKTCYLELYDQLLGTAGVVPALVKLRSQFGGNIVALDGNGAAKSLRKDLEAEGFEVILVSGPNRVDACGGFYDDALVGALRFENDPMLNTAMSNAVKQSVGGRAWIFARNRTLADISGFYAVVFARWLFKEKAGDTYNALDSVL
jgi:phage terminase large subunit-like protein